MKHSDILGRIVRSLGLAGVLFALTFSGCTEVDDTLGAGFAPDNQRMKTGRRTLKPCFKTSLFRTEGIRTSNIRVGLMGSTLSDTFGLRRPDSIRNTPGASAPTRRRVSAIGPSSTRSCWVYP